MVGWEGWRVRVVLLKHEGCRKVVVVCVISKTDSERASGMGAGERWSPSVSVCFAQVEMINKPAVALPPLHSDPNSTCLKRHLIG